MRNTFSGGVHPKGHKELAKDKSITRGPLPKKVIIPLVQGTGNPAKCLVKNDDVVFKGQLIGEADGFISSMVHSSVSGKVTSISKSINPVYGMTDCVFIESDGLDKEINAVKRTVSDVSREEIIDVVKNSGIVGLGGAAFPSYVKLMGTEKHKVDSLVINSAECEPYLTCDYRLMLEKPSDILKGIDLLDKATYPSRIFIGIEDNKKDAVKSVEKALREMGNLHLQQKTNIVTLKTKYPQGGEKQLIKAILNREVPPQKLPLNVGCIVHNVGTAYAVYEAVYHGKPLIERCVTFTGTCLKNTGNFIVRIGTSVQDVVNECCGGFTEEPAKIILGGPMMGIAHYTLDIPIIKGMSGVLFLSKSEAEILEETACIKCGKCVDVCPMNMIPTHIARNIKKDNVAELEGLNVNDCMECGACAFECPARIPLVQYIKLAKAKLRTIRK